MTTCIIIEDDPLARESLSSLIKKNFSQELNLVAVAESVKEGVNLILQKSPELIFLNIELPDENGFSLFSYFPSPNFDVIFTTSSPDYAITAIKYMAVDYLMKPIDLIDLGAAIVRFMKKKNALKIVDESIKRVMDTFKMGTSFQEKIALPTCDGFRVIPYNDILYCQASENYTYIFTLSKDTILITKTLKNLEELLPSTNFFRIHKSVLININYVKSFSKRDGCIVTLDTGQKFEVASRRQEDFVNVLVKREPVTPLY